MKCSYDDAQSEYKCYRQNSEQDETPAKWFVRKLKDLALHLQGLYENPRPMRDLTPAEQVEFARAQVCHICRKPFKDTDKMVRDHCHLTTVSIYLYFFYLQLYIFLT